MIFALKIFISALIIAVASEVAKRSTLAGAIIASLPLTSMLVITWLYFETKDTAKIASVSHSIFWAVLPSLLFLAVFAWLLRAGLKFGYSFFLSTAVMVIGYGVYIAILDKFGIKL